MSVKVMTWVWHSDRTAELRGNYMLAMLALADVSDDDGHCVFVSEGGRSQAALAAKARMSVATFRRVTQSLVEDGVLEVERPSHLGSNAYRIVMNGGSAQSERSQVSAGSAQSERYQRSRVSAATSYRRINSIYVLEAFDSFWDVYPRKAGKEAARKAFAKASEATSTTVIVDGAKRLAADPNLPEKQFIPHPATWLNQGRWDDEPLPERSGRQGAADVGRDEWMLA